MNFTGPVQPVLNTSSSFTQDIKPTITPLVEKKPPVTDALVTERFKSAFGPTNYVDFSRERYPGLNWTPLSFDIEAVHEKRQSFMDKVLNSTAQFGLIAGASFVNVLAENVIEPAAIATQDRSISYDNFFTKLTHDALIKGQDMFPIYRKNETDFFSKASNTIWQTAPQVGFSIGTMAGVVATEAALSYLTAQSGGTAGAATTGLMWNTLRKLPTTLRNGFRNITNLSGLKSLYKNIDSSKMAAGLRQTFGEDVLTANWAKGVWLNSIASSMEAGVEAYGVKEELKHLGINDAALEDAAMKDFYLNKAILSVTNIPMLNMFTKAGGSRNLGTGILGNTFKKVSNLLFDSNSYINLDPSKLITSAGKGFVKGVVKPKMSSRIFKDFLLSGVAESFEEFAQGSAADSIIEHQKASPYAYIAAGDIISKMITDSGERITSRKGADEIASGFIMGGFMGGGRMAINKTAGSLIGVDLRKAFNQQKIDELTTEKDKEGKTYTSFSNKMKKVGKYLYDTTSTEYQYYERFVEELKENSEKASEGIRKDFKDLINKALAVDSKTVDYSLQQAYETFKEKNPTSKLTFNDYISQENIEGLTKTQSKALDIYKKRKEFSTQIKERFFIENKDTKDTENFNEEEVINLLSESLAKQNSQYFSAFVQDQFNIDTLTSNLISNKKGNTEETVYDIASLQNKMRVRFIEHLHKLGLKDGIKLRLEGYRNLNSEDKQKLNLVEDFDADTADRALEEDIKAFDKSFQSSFKEVDKMSLTRKYSRYNIPDPTKEGVEAKEDTTLEYHEYDEATDTYKEVKKEFKKGDILPMFKRVYKKHSDVSHQLQERFVKEKFAYLLTRTIHTQKTIQELDAFYKERFSENHPTLDLTVILQYGTVNNIDSLLKEIIQLEEIIKTSKDVNLKDNFTKEELEYYSQKLKILNKIANWHNSKSNTENLFIKKEKQEYETTDTLNSKGRRQYLVSHLIELLKLERKQLVKASAELDENTYEIDIFDSVLTDDVNNLLRIHQESKDVFNMLLALKENKLDKMYDYFLYEQIEQEILREKAAVYKKIAEDETTFREIIPIIREAINDRSKAYFGINELEETFLEYLNNPSETSNNKLVALMTKQKISKETIEKLGKLEEGELDVLKEIVLEEGSNSTSAFVKFRNYFEEEASISKVKETPVVENTTTPETVTEEKTIASTDNIDDTQYFTEEQFNLIQSELDKVKTEEFKSKSNDINTAINQAVEALEKDSTKTEGDYPFVVWTSDKTKREYIILNKKLDSTVSLGQSFSDQSEIDAKRAEIEVNQDEVNKKLNIRNNDNIVRQAINDSNKGKITVKELDAVMKKWNDENGLTELLKEANKLRLELKSLEQNLQEPNQVSQSSTTLTYSVTKVDLKSRSALEDNSTNYSNTDSTLKMHKGTYVDEVRRRLIEGKSIDKTLEGKPIDEILEEVKTLNIFTNEELKNTDVLQMLEEPFIKKQQELLIALKEDIKNKIEELGSVNKVITSIDFDANPYMLNFKDNEGQVYGGVTDLLVKITFEDGTKSVFVMDFKYSVAEEESLLKSYSFQINFYQHALNVLTNKVSGNDFDDFSLISGIVKIDSQSVDNPNNDSIVIVRNENNATPSEIVEARIKRVTTDYEALINNFNNSANTLLDRLYSLKDYFDVRYSMVGGVLKVFYLQGEQAYTLINNKLESTEEYKSSESLTSNDAFKNLELLQEVLPKFIEGNVFSDVVYNYEVENADTSNISAASVNKSTKVLTLNLKNILTLSYENIEAVIKEEAAHATIGLKTLEEILKNENSNETVYLDLLECD